MRSSLPEPPSKSCSPLDLGPDDMYHWYLSWRSRRQGERRSSGPVGARQSACRRSSASTPTPCSSAARGMRSSWSLPTNGQRDTSTPSPAPRRTSPGRRRAKLRSERSSSEVPARYGYLHLRPEAERGGSGTDALAESRGRRGQRHHRGRAPHGRGKELLAREDHAPGRELPPAADGRRVHLERRRLVCERAREARARGEAHRSAGHVDRGTGGRAEADPRLEQRARVRQGLWTAPGKLDADLVRQRLPRPGSATGNATLVFLRSARFVLCLSERTLLPVVLPARELATLGTRL